jgi:hypothetical protein
MAKAETHTPDVKLALDVTKDHFDTILKGSNLLLVAHGAGLAGALRSSKSRILRHYMAASGSEYTSPYLARVSWRRQAGVAVRHYCGCTL